MLIVIYMGCLEKKYNYFFYGVIVNDKIRM